MCEFQTIWEPPNKILKFVRCLQMLWLFGVFTCSQPRSTLLQCVHGTLAVFGVRFEMCCCFDSVFIFAMKWYKVHLDWCSKHNGYIRPYDVPELSDQCTTRKFFLEFRLIDLHVQNVFTVIVERCEQVPFSMAIENGELIHECCAWEQQDWNMTMKQRKEVRRGEWMWKEVYLFINLLIYLFKHWSCKHCKRWKQQKTHVNHYRHYHFKPI